jgi:4-amino-4-deoxy-L-arabinose transferase-like glycosyltransferase
VQLHDGRTGHYNPWHPPVMAWMLGLADSLLRGAGLFVLFDTLLFFASLASLLWLVRRRTWVLPLLASFCAALPQVLLYQGIVWKDVLFADAAVAGFVLLSHAATQWEHGGRRWILIGAGFALLALATLARQNGIVVLLFGGLALALVARGRGFRRRGALALGTGATAAALGFVIVASAALATRTTGVPQPAGQIRLLQLYDLIGEQKYDPTLKLVQLSSADPGLSSLIRSAGVRLYSPVRNDTLFASSKLQDALTNAKPAVLASQWQQVLLAHPGDYLRTRARVFFWVFATPDIGQCMPYYTGVTGPPQDLRALGLETRFRPQDRALAYYAALFSGTPLFSHVLYGALALAFFAFLLWRRRPADIPMACLLAAAAAYTLSFFVISIACDYRYLLVLDLSALVAVFYCVASGSRPAKSPRFTGH